MSIKEVSLDLATNLASVGVLVWVLRQAGVLDSGSAQYRAQAVVLAADRARSQAQRRANSFIHDHILSALIAVANGLPDRAALRASARQALDSLSRDTAPSVPVAAGGLLGDIASRVGALAGDIRFDVATTSEGEVPPEVAQAITEATLEAVRNSLCHAGDEGSSVRRTVTLTSDAASLTIEVGDDGRGFDPNEAPVGRHGVSGSIVARMRDAGGDALIHSAPNQGTTVSLKWTRPGPGQDAASAAGANEAVAWSQYLASSPESVGARLIGAGLIGVHLVMVVHECYTDQYRHWEPVMVSLVLMLVPAVLLLWSWPAATPPNWVAWLTVVIVGVANLLVLSQIVATGWPGYSSWCTGSGTDLCCVLIIRGRPRQAWAGIGMITVMVGYWVVATDRPLLMVVTYMMGHYFMVTAWQGIAHLSTRATAQIAVTQRETARLQAQQRAHEEADHIMTSRMASVRQRVTPLLTQVADGAAVEPELCRQAYLLEAELRDEIRAPFFTGTSIIASAHAARLRGTEVILLDDSGDSTAIDDEVRANAVNYVSTFLDLTQSNRVVVRLNPPRRLALLTIVADDARHRLNRQGVLIAQNDASIP
ncbi:MAG: ATP-binding protein [Propionibacteriaceae bacterium]|nr:ATP-binding protein [Propionibacteriaceae bacterium]